MNGKAAPFNNSKNSRSMRLARCEGVNEGFCAAAAGADCEGFSPCPFSPSALSSSLNCARSEAGLFAAPLSAGASAVSPAGGSSGRFSLSCADCAGLTDGVLAMASSHFCAAERQFRTPLSYGAVRTPTAQWTATAAGCCLLRPAGKGVGIRAVTFGRVVDYQVKDITNMGAAMAPAAAATLLHYLRDTGTDPAELDCVYTGDLGRVGSRLLAELLAAEGILLPHHADCGSLLFEGQEKQVHSGGSGPGCCAGVLCSHILPRLEAHTLHRVVFIATGALMSQTTFLQKESIPAVAHLVELRAPGETAEGNKP